MVTSVLPEGYKYLIEEEKFCSPTNYECNLRIRGMKTEEEARKWLDSLNELSLVTWKVLRTYPKSGKINIYKGEFRCQHRVHGKRKDLKKSKNTNCPARLRVCIRRYLKSTNAKAPDPLTKLWPCIVELRNVHNHCVESADSLQYRPVNEGTRKKISELFQQGHSPHSVAESLRLELLIESPETFEERENDASYCPLPGFCYREYARLFGHNYRGRLKNSVQSELESLLSPYINDEEGGRAVISSISDHLVVCICTPIMQRIHRLVPESRSIIHLQIFCHPDKKTKLFLFTTWIQIGEVPLGVIITDTEAHEVFTTGLQLLKSILPTGSFFGVGYPELFVMPDDDTRRRDAFTQEFPHSLVLTSKYFQQKRFQDFLLNPKNDIPKPSHSDLFKKFKVMLNSATDEDFVSNFEKASSLLKPGPAGEEEELSSITSTLPQLELSQLMNLFWTESNGFANVFRPGLFATPLENPASEGVQILSHLILTELFERVKSFNLVQLSQFIISSFELFLRNRLTGPLYVESLLKIFLPTKGPTNLQKLKKLEESFFEVPSEGGVELVEMSLLHCTCRSARICPHQSAVIHKYYTATIPYPFHLQGFYVDLAGGKEVCGSQVKKQPVHLLPKTNRAPFASNHDHKTKDGTLEEGEALIGEVTQWLTGHLNQNPAKFLPALKSMVRAMDSIGSDHEAVSAAAGFGSGYKPIRVRSELNCSPPPLILPPPIPLVPTQEVSFITTLGTEAEEILGGIPHATYLPLQEIPGQDGAPGYFILVTDDKGMFSGQEEEQPEIVQARSLESAPTEAPLPISVVKRKPIKKGKPLKTLIGI